MSFEVIQPKTLAKDPITVLLTISDGKNKWTLTYRNVQKIMMNCELTSGQFRYEAGLDTWGYNEFLPSGESQLTHEILFASGATILIQFRNKKLFINKTSVEYLR